MEEIRKKYPALEFPCEYVELVVDLIKKHGDNCNKKLFYKDFKANIDCIALEPSEYEIVVAWFCKKMEYEITTDI